MNTAKDTTDKLLGYLDDHIRYEWDMLRYSFTRLHRTPPGPEWNIVFEAYCVHARNLYDFLRHEGKTQTTFRADDFVSGRSKPSPLLAFNELDGFLFHMSTSRAEKAKLTLERLTELQDWIDREWVNWAQSLPEPYNGVLDANPVARPTSLEGGVQSSTACTHVQIVKSASWVRPDGSTGQ